jgi:DNA-binding IclR family transcriptional regulator
MAVRPATAPLTDPTLGPGTGRSDFVHSLAKGLELLSAFERGEMLGNHDLAERTGLPKTTVSRLVRTLEQLDYLRLDAHSRKYVIGTRVMRLGATVQRFIGLQRVAKPFLDELAREVDTTVIMGSPERTEAVLLEIARPAFNLLTVNAHVGHMVPLESSSVGLACLVGMPVSQQVSVLENIQARHPNDWETIRRRIEVANINYRRHGFVTSLHPDHGRVSGVGVPLTLGGKGVFAFACVGPSYELTAQRMSSMLGPRLVATVDKIASAMRNIG